MILQYDQAKCYGCGLCESVCPEKAVKMIKRKEREKKGKRKGWAGSDIFLSRISP
jgi:formate hydrogenlyase subunit 6/NADH:ubiquinone oxidoreductase subunit I